MKDLAIVIVNYKVKYHIHLCLSSIEKSNGNFSKEIWIVDNASKDNSREFLTKDFPEIHYIQSDENLGFSKANNLALRKLKAKYVLLLNPDTLLQEDTLQQCFDFMEKHPEVGGLAVPMYNGKGEFAPESKRGIPTPWVAFTKILKLYKLFPKSPLFGKYYMTHLDKDKPAPIEVMSGAFMFLRMDVLNKIGFLDETFFMYGEDIDLSYRILQAGYKNYYLPSTRIIHFKGEATDKNSLDYLRIFYNAMEVFVEKHFSRKGKLYVSFLKIVIRSGMYFMYLKNTLKKYGLYVWEIVSAMLFSFLFFGNLNLFLPSFIASLTGIPLGNFRKPHTLKKTLFKFFADVSLPFVYGMFLRLPFASVLGFSAGYAVSNFAVRIFINKKTSGSFFPEFVRRKGFVAAAPEEARRIKNIFQKYFPGTDLQEGKEPATGFTDYIFSMKKTSVRKIIDLMTAFKKKGRKFFIASPKRDFIITSKQILTCEFSEEKNK